MFGPRMLLGAAIGGALVYFLDPQHGTERRERVRSWWEQNREPVLNTAQTKIDEVQTKIDEVGGKANEKVAEIRSKVRSS
jgi:gas vesicle protein